MAGTKTAARRPPFSSKRHAIVCATGETQGIWWKMPDVDAKEPDLFDQIPPVVGIAMAADIEGPESTCHLIATHGNVITV